MTDRPLGDEKRRWEVGRVVLQEGCTAPRTALGPSGVPSGFVKRTESNLPSARFRDSRRHVC